MARFANIESAQDQMMQSGLPSDSIETLLDAAKDAVMFRRRLAVDAEVPTGASKLGGAPDLSATLIWPIRAAYAKAPEMIAQITATFGPTGYVPNADMLAFLTAHWSAAAPLSFLAQIDLTAMPPFEAGIVAEGRLLVFADIASFAVGASPNDLGWLQVIHDRTPMGELERRAPPDDLITRHTTNARLNYELSADEALDLSQAEVLEPFAITSLPMPSARDDLPLWEALRELDMADFTAMRGSAAPGTPTLFSDQLGGYPVPIQGDVFNDLFTASRTHLTAATLAERAGRWDPRRWSHLLSLGGESYNPAFPSSWGDGDLYIAHRNTAERPRDLGQVWAISQRT